MARLRGDPKAANTFAAQRLQSVWRGHTVRRDNRHRRRLEHTLHNYDEEIYTKLSATASPPVPKSRFYRNVEPWVCQACQFRNVGGHSCMACGSSAWLTLSLQTPTDRTLIDTAANAVVYLQPDDGLLIPRVQALSRGFMQRLHTRREKAATLLAYTWREYAEKKAQVCSAACLTAFLL